MAERNLSLTKRLEGTRDKTITRVVKFNLDQILGHFKETIAAVKSHFDTADQLVTLYKISDAEYIWRAQIVFVAGALDFYMHELTKYGLCEIYENKWDKTEKYNNIELPLSVLEKALRAGEEADWFIEYINSYYQTVTMISYESIKDQLNLLGIEYKEVADTAFYQLGSTEKTIDKLKRRLNELFYRRNIIAHQTDRLHSNAEIKDISKDIVEEFIIDVEKIVVSIDAEIRKK